MRRSQTGQIGFPCVSSRFFKGGLQVRKNVPKGTLRDSERKGAVAARTQGLQGGARLIAATSDRGQCVELNTNGCECLQI
jgi:hypothetical protein